MLFKLPESSDTNVDGKKAHDRNLITQLFDRACPGIISKDFTFFRVGRKTANNSRPIKIILKSVTEVNQLMGGFSNLDRSELGGDLNGVSLARDRTPGETKYLNDLREELKKRTDSGEKNLTIKFRNGVPKIIQKN